jgi:DNA-binding XRE family transcriptional regulator
LRRFEEDNTMSKAFAQHEAAFYQGLCSGRTLLSMAKEFGVSEAAVCIWRQKARRNEILGVRKGKPSESDNPFINLLRERRLSQRMTMDELSRLAFMAKNHISLIERGQRKPLLDTWLALVEALGGEVEVKFPPRD